MSSGRPDYLPASLDLDATIGATYIGVILSTFVAGIVLMQGITYFRSFKKDIGLFRWSVGIISVLNLLHSGCIVGAQYHWTITGWGQLALIDQATIPYPLSFLITGLVAGLVQTCYAYRIYILSARKLILPIIIMLLTLAQLGASFYCTIMAAKAGKQSLFLPYFNAAYVWLYGEAAADVLITAGLIYYLQSVRDSTTFAGTRSIATKISIITFETNLLTLLCCICSATTLQTLKDGVGPAINFLSVKVYALSLLITLNARNSLKISNSTSSVSMGNNSHWHEMSKARGPDVSNAIRIDKEAVSIAYQPNLTEKRGFHLDNESDKEVGL